MEIKATHDNKGKKLYDLTDIEAGGGVSDVENCGKNANKKASSAKRGNSGKNSGTASVI